MKTPLRLKILIVALGMLFVSASFAANSLTDKWVDVVRQSRELSNPGERIVFLSGFFLTTPYRRDTLGGGPGQPEKLVVALTGVDCFTLLDYIEAMRRSSKDGDFRQQLLNVRYRENLSWEKRRHFFTDWVDNIDIRDATAEVGAALARSVTKALNRDAGGQPLLPGVPVRNRIIRFIPTADISPEILSRLFPGDYVGIYSDQAGLDVSHVGILVRTGGKTYLRHASSRSETPEVTDSPLMPYLEGKSGIIVLRAMGK